MSFRPAHGFLHEHHSMPSRSPCACEGATILLGLAAPSQLNFDPLARLLMGIADRLLSIAGGVPREPLHSKCLEFLQSHSAPAPLVDQLARCSFAQPIRVGRLWLSRLAELDLENSDEANVPCIEHGFLIVGAGLNGDPIAVDLRSHKMAFVSHDLLWEENYDKFSEVIVPTPLSFEQFWAAALDDPEFPRDSYDASERWPDCAG